MAGTQRAVDIGPYQRRSARPDYEVDAGFAATGESPAKRRERWPCMDIVAMATLFPDRSRVRWHTLDEELNRIPGLGAAGLHQSDRCGY